MITDTPSSRDEEIPTPRCNAMYQYEMLGVDGVLIPLRDAKALERDLIRLSAEREKERSELDAEIEELDGDATHYRNHLFRYMRIVKDLRATLAERDKELAEVKGSFESVSNIANARGRKIGELETICLQKDNQVDNLRAQLLAAQTVNGKLREALLFVRVYDNKTPATKGWIKTEEALASSPDPTLLDEVDKLKREKAEVENTFLGVMRLIEPRRVYPCHCIWGHQEKHDATCPIPRAKTLLSRLRQSTRENPPEPSSNQTDK